MDSHSKTSIKLNRRWRKTIKKTHKNIQINNNEESDIKTVSNTNTKKESLFLSPKNKIPGMQTPGAYEILFPCG